MPQYSQKEKQQQTDITLCSTHLQCLYDIYTVKNERKQILRIILNTKTNLVQNNVLEVLISFNMK